MQVLEPAQRKYQQQHIKLIRSKRYATHLFDDPFLRAHCYTVHLVLLEVDLRDRRFIDDLLDRSFKLSLHRHR